MLYTGMIKLVWMKDMTPNLKAIAYTTIGQIVQRMPSIINKSLTELQVRYFMSLGGFTQAQRTDYEKFASPLQNFLLRCKCRV